MIGYILRLFTEIFGKTVFVVKMADFVVTSLTLISFYKLASCFLSKQKLQRAIILISSTLFISILSFNSTPDVPLLLFWTLSVTYLYKAIFERKNNYWILAGITMGLAFDSKYTALHFDYLGDNLSDLNTKNALFIDSDKRFKNRDKKGKIHPKLSEYFETITELEPIIIKKNSKEVRKFWVFYCTNYQYLKR